MRDTIKSGGDKIMKFLGTVGLLGTIGVVGCLQGYLFTIPRWVPMTAVWFVAGMVLLFEVGRYGAREDGASGVWAYLFPLCFGSAMAATYAIYWVPGV